MVEAACRSRVSMATTAPKAPVPRYLAMVRSSTCTKLESANMEKCKCVLGTSSYAWGASQRRGSSNLRERDEGSLRSMNWSRPCTIGPDDPLPWAGGRGIRPGIRPADPESVSSHPPAGPAVHPARTHTGEPGRGTKGSGVFCPLPPPPERHARNCLWELQSDRLRPEAPRAVRPQAHVLTAEQCSRQYARRRRSLFSRHLTLT